LFIGKINYNQIILIINKILINGYVFNIALIYTILVENSHNLLLANDQMDVYKYLSDDLIDFVNNKDEQEMDMLLDLATKNL